MRPGPGIAVLIPILLSGCSGCDSPIKNSPAKPAPVSKAHPAKPGSVAADAKPAAAPKPKPSEDSASAASDPPSAPAPSQAHEGGKASSGSGSGIAAIRSKYSSALKKSRSESAGVAYQDVAECYQTTREHAGEAEWDQLGIEIAETLESLADAANADAASEINSSRPLILK